MTSRGVEQRCIFLDDEDREKFLEILKDVVARYQWDLNAYVLMSNHYHLFLITPQPTLSRGMQKLGGDFAEWFNLRHQRVGHLFQGRFKSHLVDSESYLLEVSRYVVLNPVRARMVGTAREWPWSSYGATAGLETAPGWLHVDPILDRFDPTDRRIAAERYRDFVAAGVGQTSSPWENLVAQAFLGSAKFLNEIEQRVRSCARSREHPRRARELRLASLEQIRRSVEIETGVSIQCGGREAATARRLFALLARTETLATLSEIGVWLSVGTSAARYLVRAAEESAGDRAFATLREEVLKRIDACKLQM